jgi:hypothetical protein
MIRARGPKRKRGGRNAAGHQPGINLPPVVRTAPSKRAVTAELEGEPVMKVACPHCGASAFRGLSGVDKDVVVECLNCGKTFAINRLIEVHDGPGSRKPRDDSTI